MSRDVVKVELEGFEFRYVIEDNKLKDEKGKTLFVGSEKRLRKILNTLVELGVVPTSELIEGSDWDDYTHFERLKLNENSEMVFWHRGIVLLIIKKPIKVK